MQEAGAKLLKHYRDTAFMGAWEVLLNARQISANFADCHKQITSVRPDVVILIDYPGFNMRIARFAKQSGIRVFYYISPKFWAWREGRVKNLRKWVDRLYIIFPFEEEFFRRFAIEAHFLGNPLIDQIENWKKSAGSPREIRASLGLDNRPLIALLAGSRIQEVTSILPSMVSVADSLPDYQFVIAGMSHLPEKIYDDIVASQPVKVVYNRTYDLLSVAEAALVTSGTATLEAALFNVPQAVCYRTSPITYHLARRIVRVRFLSLVNLIMDREVVRELIQGDLNQMNLHRELQTIIKSGYKHERIRSDYAILRKVLGGSGASGRVASDMVRNLSDSKGR